jgi:hypothetical protein
LALRDEVDRASMFEEIVGTSKPGEPWNEREIIEAARWSSPEGGFPGR